MQRYCGLVGRRAVTSTTTNAALTGAVARETKVGTDTIGTNLLSVSLALDADAVAVTVVTVGTYFILPRGHVAS